MKSTFWVAARYIMAYMCITSAIILYGIGVFNTSSFFVSQGTFMLVLSFIVYQNAKDSDE